MAVEGGDPCRNQATKRGDEWEMGVVSNANAVICSARRASLSGVTLDVVRCLQSTSRCYGESPRTVAILPLRAVLDLHSQNRMAKVPRMTQEGVAGDRAVEDF